LAKHSQRFFAIFFAVLFLVTSSSVAIAYIISNVQSKDNSKTAASTSSKTSVTNNTNSSTNQSNSSSQGKLPNFTPVSSVVQLESKDLTVGTGETVKSGATVSVTYSGAVAATGDIFQTSSQPISLSLSQVIVGWQQGIPGMKVGGTRQLLIPADMAYGANPPSGSGIPANAALVFDVSVKSISSN
jgi:FKBP-type peptidyl-prolyl cis-trans isomerase